MHLPDVWTAAVTFASGMAWSFIYYRYRLLLPLAFSHAALGSAFIMESSATISPWNGGHLCRSGSFLPLLLPHDCDDDRPLPGFDVALQMENLLPRSQNQIPLFDGDRERRAKHRSL